MAFALLSPWLMLLATATLACNASGVKRSAHQVPNSRPSKQLKTHQLDVGVPVARNDKLLEVAVSSVGK